MLRRILVVFTACAGVAGLGALVVPGCSSDTTPTNTPADMAKGCADPFAPAPECTGASIAPLGGSRQLVISKLEIASLNEGFDLNCDGKKDNKLYTLGALVNPQIVDAFAAAHNVVIPIEMFGYDGKDASCTKFAFYLGRVNEDADGDGKDTTWASGESDCNDHNKDVRPGVAEVMGNRVDDDCDGYADNDKKGVAPADATDLDGDGVSLKAGDCNDDPKDAAARSIHRGAMDVCGNGLDEDCDGIVDNDVTCDPFTDNNAKLHVQAASFKNMPSVPPGGTTMAGSFLPYITFPDGKTAGGVVSAGPDLFELNLNVQDFDLKLTLSGTRITMKTREMNGATYVTDGLLGGVLSVSSLAQIHIEAAGVITKDQSLADAIFVGAASSILGVDSDKDGHYRPDIDLDGDGIESFWQEGAGTITDAGVKVQAIDTCKDGDGTIVRNGDNGVPYCPLAKDAKGRYRFVDGLSTTLKFAAVPARLTDVVPQ